MGAGLPSSAPFPLRVNARELLRQPGSQRPIVTVLSAEDLGIDDERVTGDIVTDLTATSSVDGIVVHGTISVPWQTTCSRCLAETSGLARIHVDELYQDGVSDDAFEIEGDQIDLVPAVRENVLLELPDDALCRDDCAGICSVCGVDRNEGSCECETIVRDERWAALDAVRFDDD